MYHNDKSWTAIQWLVVCLWLYPTCHGALGQTDMHEKVNYHLTELRKGLYDIQTSHVHKRSTDLDREAIIYNSLLAFCSQMTVNGNTNPGHNRNSSTNPTKPNIDTTTQQSLGSLVLPGLRKADDEDSGKSPKWPRLEVYPNTVQAQRVGEKVWLIFDVFHSVPAYAAVTHSFDFKKIDIDYPSGFSTPIVSEVRFELDASMCVGDDSVDARPSIVFGDENTKDSFLSQVTIDLCTFDQIWNGTLDSWEKNEATFISQEIPKPLFKVVDHPSNSITTQKGKNVTLEMDLQLYDRAEMTVLVRLWDRSIGKMLESHGRISIQNDGKMGITLWSVDRDSKKISQEKIIIELQVINETFASTEDQNYEVTKNVSARVRMTVNTSRGRRSGELILQYFWRKPDYYESSIVEYLFARRAIMLKLPKKARVLPRNQAKISNFPRQFECDENGIKYYPKHGKNCTIFCKAYGSGIKSVKITNPKSTRTPVKSVSYILNKLGFAMIDLGPASKDIEGKYNCMVTTSKGKTIQRETNMYTSLFTDVQNLTVNEFTNGTTRVTCTAFGAQPLNISIEAINHNGNSERLDNKTRNNLRVITRENQRILTLFVSTDQLRYPVEYLHCAAEGERGRGSENLYLSNYIKNQNPLVPKINSMPNASFIQDYHNGTAAITCEATGGKPLTMWVMYGGQAEAYRIDDKSENVRTVMETTGGKVLTLFVPRKTLMGSTSWVYCRVSNEFGEDWKDFYIHDFL